MEKLKIAKKTLVIIAGFGAGAIAAQVIANNSAPKSKLQFVTMTVGAIALGGIVASEASKYTEKTFDELVDIAKQVFAQVEAKKEENK